MAVGYRKNRGDLGGRGVLKFLPRRIRSLILSSIPTVTGVRHNEDIY
jgi:hypothetical protein